MDAATEVGCAAWPWRSSLGMCDFPHTSALEFGTAWGSDRRDSPLPVDITAQACARQQLV